MTSLGDTIEKVGITLTNNLPTSSGTMSTSDGTNGRTGTVNKKLEDLEQHVYDVQNPQHMTTDFGHKVSNTDNWLKVGSKDHVGAHLLEDQVAREKVIEILAFFQDYKLTILPRSTGLIMNVSRNGLCTPEVRQHSASSHYRRVWRISPVLVFLPTRRERLQSSCAFRQFRAAEVVLTLFVTFEVSP